VSVGDSCERIERWLAGHAPGSLATWNPPASRSTIAAAEERAGMEFPAELVELQRRHDGAHDERGVVAACAFLPWFTAPMSAMSMAGIASNTTDLLANQFADDPGMVGYWWHPRWLPFGFNIAANNLFLDLRPGQHYGAVGWFNHEGEAQQRLSPSLGVFLSDIADALEGDGAVLGEWPVVDERGFLNWVRVSGGWVFPAGEF